MTAAAALPALAVVAAVPALATPITPPAALDPVIELAAAPAIDSREAMVVRAKQIVDVLGSCYVREGWKLDAERAAQFVESVGTFDEDDGACPKFEMALDWMEDHGQSLDWLFLGRIDETIATLAALRATVGTPIDAELIALGERLKIATAETDRLEPDRRLYNEAWQASGFDKKPKGRANEAAYRRFRAKTKENGYDIAYKKWNAASKVKFKIARAILKIPSNSRIGDGIRAAAALVDHQDILTQETPMLWEMAARAGFDPPASIAKDLRRMAAAHARKVVQS